MERMTARITGRVQGVGFRAFVIQEATRLGLTGTVRNCPDGAVEVVAEGAGEALRRLEAALARGPRAAQVDRVEVRMAPATGEFQGFGLGR
jgi:acylphosphatase